MVDMFPEHLREWITAMQQKRASAWVIQYCKGSILNAIFTTALNDQVTYIHPRRGVKIPSVPSAPRRIVTPEQFNLIYQALPDADLQLLIETYIESGLRWGELTELRVKNLENERLRATVAQLAAALHLGDQQTRSA
jgi:integrase